MSETNYPGIDYSGPGSQANRDSETGIRYGVIIVQTMRDSLELWVFKSPFYTYAQFCSPCVPGACNLDSPLVNVPRDDDERGGVWEDMEWESLHPQNKCYCLGHEWFDDSKAPYRVFRVDTNEEVLP